MPSLKADYGGIRLIPSKASRGQQEFVMHRQGAGAYFGVLRSIDGKDHAEYNVSDGTPGTCIWIGRQEKESKGEPLLGLRAVLVSSKQNSRGVPVTLVRSFHLVTYTDVEAFWDKMDTHHPDDVRQYLVSTRDDHTGKLPSLEEMFTATAAPGPWVSCSSNGCCKITP
jgi:hypothetical protein